MSATIQPDAIYVLQPEQRVSRSESQRLLLLVGDVGGNDSDDESGARQRDPTVHFALRRMRGTDSADGDPLAVAGNSPLPNRLDRRVDGLQLCDGTETLLRTIQVKK